MLNDQVAIVPKSYIMETPKSTTEFIEDLLQTKHTLKRQER